MKYIYITLLFTIFGWSQTHIDQKPHCISDDIFNKVTNENPIIKSRIEKVNKQVAKVVSYKNTNKTTNANHLVTIPVLFYIVHNGQPIGTGSNISDNQINSQLIALNDYFSPYNIRFCLATRRDGQTISSITRINNSSISNHTSNTQGQGYLTSIIGSNGGPSPVNYLRIWVVNSINGANSGILGYGTFPGILSNFDGIVMKHDAFGDINNCTSGCNLIPGYDSGKVLAHEVGHYLGLFHTFQGGCTGLNSATCSNEGDFVCDTPPVREPNIGCPITNVNSCTESNDLPDNINNYMDYTNDYCRNMFTVGQEDRMHAVLSEYRNELISEDNQIFTGVCGSANLISSNFNPSTYQPCYNSSVTFNPIATGMTYSWNFGDTASGTANTSTLQNPTHTFSNTSISSYTVTLTVTNGTQTATTSKRIYVTNCSAIITEDANWLFASGNSINFSSGVPVTSMTSTGVFGEADACVSNQSGQLLFFSRGSQVRNIGFDSYDLLGSTSSHRGTLIVKDPNTSNPNRYYLFTSDGRIDDAPTATRKGLRYNIIEASSPTSFTIAPTALNLPLTAPTANGYTITSTGGIECGEGITAISSQDGYWIITIGRKSTGYFFMVYRLNSSGLSFVSETQTVSGPNETGLMSMEVSPDGNRIVLNIDESGNTVFGSYLYDFNKFTGQVLSNPINLNIGRYAYGAAFSPNNNLLYINSDPNNFQYNLQDFNHNSSRKLFYNSGNAGSYGDIQRGPDNKLYMTYPFVGTRSLYVIHEPNNLITATNSNACSFSKDGPTFPNNISIYSYGLPNMINSKKETAFLANSISSYPTGCLSRNFFPNSVGTTFNWDFGDPAGANNIVTGVTLASHTFSAGGTYTVRLFSSSNVLIAQTNVTVGATFNSPIYGSSSTCINGMTNNSIVLNPGQSAVWSITGGAGTISGINTQSDVTVHWTQLPGTISLTVTDINGCTTTLTRSISLSSSITPTFTQVAPICAGASLSSLPTISNNGIIGTWAPQLNNLQTTMYTFTPTLGQCATPTTMTIIVNEPTIPTFDSIAPICFGSTTNPLQNISNNAIPITGTWDPPFSNTTTTNYSFTPDGGQCATGASITITVLDLNDPSCSQNECLPYLTLSDPEPTTYNYSHTYNVKSWIECNNDYEVNGVKINLFAGKRIVLKPDTYIHGKSEFLAKIQACPESVYSKTNELTNSINNISVYPNPTLDFFTINSSETNLKSVEIMSIEGKVIFTRNDLNGDRLEIDFTKYQNGIYIVNITTIDNKVTSQKIIKN